MKALLTSILTLFITVNSLAQNNEIWTLQASGGDSDAGLVLKVDSNNKRITVINEFSYYNGEQMGDVKLCLANNGKYYGTTSRSIFKYPRQTGYGVIFEYDVQSKTYKVVHEFETPTGSSPESGPIMGTNGMLYGSTYYGGTNHGGTLYKFNPQNYAYTLLMNLDSAYGKNPRGPLFQASNGNLYGTTYLGGSHNLGTLFEYSLATGQFIKKADFDGTNGRNPQYNLEEWKNGWIFGTTTNGGQNDKGVIYKYNFITDTFLLARNMDTYHITQGYLPSSGFTRVNDHLFMTNRANQVGGIYTSVIAKYDPNSHIFSAYYHLDPSLEGSYPNSQLLYASNDSLYGTNLYHRRHGLWSGVGQGTIFAVDTNLSGLSVKCYFDDEIRSPRASLIELQDSSILGYHSHTVSLAINREGFYRLNKKQDSIIPEFQFKGSKTGYWPVGKLVQASDSCLYGLNQRTNNNLGGNVFKINTKSNSIQYLYDFSTDSLMPTHSMLEISPLKFIGVGYKTGKNIIYEYNAQTNNTVIKNNFDTVTAPYQYTSNLIQVSNGNVYGYTSAGGNNNKGMIFKYDTISGDLTSLRNLELDSINGTNWRNDFTEFQNSLYIPFKNYISNRNGVLAFNFNTNSIIKYYSNSTSFNLFGFQHALNRHPNGKFYAIANGGGVNNNGGIYSFDLANNTFTKVKDFDYNNNGHNPRGNILISQNSNLYYKLINSTGFENGIELNLTTYFETVLYSNRIYGVRGSNNPFIEIQSQLATSVKEKRTSDLTLYFYPNPASSFLYFPFSSSKTMKTIYDLNGKTLINSTSNQIDVQQLSNGVYFVRTENGNSGKLIISKN
jgi:uncharacterized repeat protein (TIGR03803 family)